jgi:RND family efflux transporter MFP subunit
MRAALALALLLLTGAAPAPAGYVVSSQSLPDEKAVFATVESRNIVPARARIGGTLAALSVHDGAEVTQGQVIALVTDDKLQLQLRSLDAQIAGLKAQVAEAETDLGRIETLARTGAASRQQLDQTRTALDVAKSTLAARTAERAVVAQQMSEGAVLAPTAGRVLQVPLTQGAVLLPGETVARIAEANFVLRLSVPEYHARTLRAGDRVRLDGADLGTNGPVFGRVTLVYPQIQDGRVIADAAAPGIGSYFVGQRILVWIAAGERQSFVIPSHLIVNRFGLSYVRRQAAHGTVIEIPVQRGRDLPTPRMPDGVEILAGLRDGDVLVAP